MIRSETAGTQPMSPGTAGRQQSYYQTKILKMSAVAQLLNVDGSKGKSQEKKDVSRWLEVESSHHHTIRPTLKKNNLSFLINMKRLRKMVQVELAIETAVVHD